MSGDSGGPGTGGPPTEGLVPRHPEDGAAFEPLYERLAPAVWAWACCRIPSVLRQRLDPEDIVQEVWVRAMGRFDTFDPERSPFRAWIFRIAQLVLLEGLRAVNRAGAGGDASSVFDLEAVPQQATTIATRLARDEELRAFVDGLAHLSEDERNLLVFRGLEGLSYEEVGDRLGLTSEAARKRWTRLRARFDASALPETLLERA